MKGNFSASSKGAWLRNGLVVFQFMISIILIVGTLVVNEQMSFMQNKNLGFDKEQVLVVKRAFALDKKFETFIEEVRRINEVKAVGATSAMIGNRDDVNGETFQPEGSNEVLTVKAIRIDDDFSDFIGFELKEGRFFSRESNDSLNVILNETAVKTMGLGGSAGKKTNAVG
jgi:putative ABC transport system permease protein